MAEPQKYEIAGRSLRCSFCGGDTFHSGEVLTNTRGLTFLNLDWLNASATVFECAACGQLMWFRDPSTSRAEPLHEVKVERISEAEIQRDAKEPFACLSCGTEISPGQLCCPKCGWSYVGKK